MGITSATQSEISYGRLLEDDAESIEISTPKFREPILRIAHIVFTIFNITLFMISLGVLVFSFAFYRNSIADADTNILQQITFYSPPIDTLNPKWEPHDFITRPISSSESIFRQDPSPIVDEAWDRVADLGVIPLTAQQVLRLNKDPNTVVKAPDDWKVGENAHLGQIDGIHLLHCLNSMRKILHYNFPYYYPRGHSTAYHAHLSHCQEALAQWLMCQPSLELITFNWVERHKSPFPDFDITRKCWDFRELLAWQDEHRIQSLNSEMWKGLRIPNDTMPNPSPVLNEETADQSWVQDVENLSQDHTKKP
ncbi:hypothetical protein V8C37DRAFT_417510 [Trichoderma ceciliae]